MAQGSKVWTVFSIGSALIAATAAKKALAASWKAATGKEPPANPAHPEVSTAEAVAWASASRHRHRARPDAGVRRAASYYRRSTGHLPPNLDAVDA